MSFDNIGVTKPLPATSEEDKSVRPLMPYRYLTCADCEWEPIGFQELGDAPVGSNGVEHRAYLSAHRVCLDFDASSAEAKMPLVEYRKTQEARFKAYLTEQMRSSEARKAAAS